MLDHGGSLAAATREYGSPADGWLDLSTGISPHAYPLPPLPDDCWRRLPEREDGLAEAAEAHYGARALPVPGSQAAIQLLPRLRGPCRVHVLAPTYAEHAAAWKRAGHTVRELSEEGLDANMDEADVVVVSNPNNPNGRRLPPRRLLCWRVRLAARGGWLVVDEAFADAHPELSVADRAGAPGLVVLRSLGKFFGLAGLRVGFVLAKPQLLEALERALGPWAVNGPGRFAAKAALADRSWQAAARHRLASDSERLAALLARRGLEPGGGTALFQWVPASNAPAVADALGRRGVLVRRFRDGPALRFGLPAKEADWARLEQALAASASVISS